MNSEITFHSIKEKFLRGDHNVLIHVPSGMSSSEMSALEMYSMDKTSAPSILASLRIGSENYELSEVASLLGIFPDKVRPKGTRELVKPPDRYFTFRSNFANSGDDSLLGLDSINPWLSCRLSSIEQAPSVPALLQSCTVEATLWVFLGGYPAGSIPPVEPAIRKRAAKLNVTIYFEHYFDGDPDETTGSWPTRLAIKHNTDDYISDRRR